MKNINQISMMKEHLLKEKDKYIMELSKMNMAIEKKQDIINKMLTYQNDYNNSERLSISRSIPTLIQNISNFSTKINEVIKQAEFEIKNMNKMKESILVSIDKIEKKINLMNSFSERCERNEKILKDAVEQKSEDGVTITKFIRDHHD